MAILTNATDIHLRSSQTMNLLARSPVSISTWINANWTGGGGAARSMVGIYGPATDVALGTPVTAMQIGTQAQNGDLVCWTWGGGDLVATGTGVMNAFNNLWTMITYTYDGTTHRLYRNGVQLATSTATQLAGYLNQVYINGYPTGGVNETMVGRIDQYSLYRRTLTVDEILTMYNAGGARHGIFDDLICRYEFDEGIEGGTTSSVIDLSGNGHTLTQTGAGTAITYTYPATVANSNITPVQ